MRYKIGDYVLIDLSVGDPGGVGISPYMEDMQKDQTLKGYRIVKAEKDFNSSRSYYKLDGDTRWTFIEEWLRPTRIYKIGGNV